MTKVDPVSEQELVFRGVMEHFFNATAWMVSFRSRDAGRPVVRLFESDTDELAERHRRLEATFFDRNSVERDFTDFETSPSITDRDRAGAPQRTGLFLRLATRLSDSRPCVATIYWSLQDSPQHIILQREGILGFIRTMASLRVGMSDLILEKSAVEETLTRLAPACLILDRDCRVIFANKAGARFQQSTGRGKAAVLNARFASVIRPILQSLEAEEGADASASSKPATKVFSVPLSDETLAPIFVSPLQTRRSSGAASAADTERLYAIFVPQNGTLPDAGVLEVSLGLTPSEARLAEFIVRGESISSAAEALAIREQTARTYLKRIFSKLGVSRQSELGAKAIEMHIPVES